LQNYKYIDILDIELNVKKIKTETYLSFKVLKHSSKEKPKTIIELLGFDLDKDKTLTFPTNKYKCMYNEAKSRFEVYFTKKKEEDKEELFQFYIQSEAQKKELKTVSIY